MENFEKLLLALPVEAQEHFEKKVFVNSIHRDGDIWKNIHLMGSDELFQLNLAIA